MFEVDTKKIGKNAKYIFIILVVLVPLILIGLLLSSDKETKQEKDLEEKGNTHITKLVINEVVNNNGGSFADPEGNIYDWIELYNGSSKNINLNNYSLSDDESKIKWVFGNVTINAGEYLIIYLSGENKEGLYANFSLNKNGGETVVLKNANGKIIDAVDTVKTKKNTSIARDTNGKWNVVNKVTPGFINTLEGYELYTKSLEKISNDVIINEVLVKNGGQFVDDYNEYSGYIELKNTTNEKISLKGYSLSDDINEPFKWNIPEIILNPGELVLFYTSGRDIKENIYHTNFRLNSKNGVVLLSKNNTINQKLDYENLINGYALSYIDGEYKETVVLSGGYENNSDGVTSFAKKYQKNKDDLVINEVMNSNYEYLAQNGYKFYDWIELKNNSNKDINLSDYYLTTTENDLDMYKLPDVTIKPNEYYIIMASGDEKLSNNSYYHANFKLGSVESLYLVKNRKIIDSIFMSEIKSGFSYGRDSEYGYVYMDTPSPAKNNNSGKYEIAYSPEFSVNEGIYNNVDSLTIKIKGPGEIYYTTNGDEPNLYSKKYTEPIVLDSTTVIRAISYEDNKYKSNIANATYIINENHTLPVMSIAIDNSDYNAIVSNSWANIEKEAQATFFDDDKSFSILCGFKEFGGSTRGLSKQSFALKFRKKYGESELHYQVFENRDNSVYKSLVLRSGSQDYEVAMIRDHLMTSLMENTDVDVQAMRPVILYINGKYWGLYYLNEKIDEDFISDHYNVSSENTNLIRIAGDVDYGSGKEYEQLLTYMRTHNMANSENYEYVKNRINIDNLIRFWVAETYITNNDIINCRLFSNPDIDNGKWHFIFFDLDFGMYFYRVNYYQIMTDPNGMGSMKIRSDLTYYLFKNNEFKKRFVEILSEELKTTWSEENILAKIDEIYNLVLPEMPRNQKRWNLKMEDWENEIENLRTFAKNRRSYLISQTKSFFNLSGEEMKVYFDDEN